MAEAFGLAVNVVAIVGAATKLSIGLYEIASALKDAGQEVRAIANDTSLFSRVLREISTVLEGNTEFVWHARSIAKDLIQVCQTVQQDGEYLLSILEPLVQQATKNRKHLLLRIRWLFQRSKFIYHREMLGSLKLNLQLLMSVMQMSREPCVQTHISLSYEVQSLRNVVDTNVHMMQMNLQSPSMIQALTNELPESLVESMPSQGDSGQINSTSTSIISEPNSDWQLNQIDRETKTLSISKQADLIAGNKDPDHQYTEGKFMCLALIPYFRLLFTQEKVLNFAAEALASQKETKQRTEALDGNTPSSLIDQSSGYVKEKQKVLELASSRTSFSHAANDTQPESTLNAQGKRPDSRPVTPKESTMRRPVTIEEISSSDDSSIISESLSNPKGRHRSERDHRTLTSTRAASGSQEESNSVPGQATEASRKLELEAKRDARHLESLTSKQQRIYLTTPAGKEYAIPWASYNQWSAIEPLILALVEREGESLDRLERKHYDILETQDAIILPDFWNKSVQPGHMLRIRMWDCGKKESMRGSDD